MTQPTLFISHGGGPWPWMPNVLPEYQKTTAELSNIPKILPGRPKAILVISSHWEEPKFTVCTAETPGMIYDYYGFPENTYQITYPAPGSSSVAAEIVTLLKNKNIECETNSSRGFDHGTFVPLHVMFPNADIPVVTMSIKKNYDPQEHYELGQALKPLRNNNILIIGSGLSYHNMRGFNTRSGGAASEKFETWLIETLSSGDAETRHQNLLHWEQAPAARLAHPREDHLIPLMTTVGAANGPGKQLFADHVMGVIMSTYWFD